MHSILFIDMKKSSNSEGVRLIGSYRFTLKDKNTGKVRVFEYENLVPDVFRNLVARCLADATVGSNLLLASTVHVGTGSTAPANADTGLETELDSVNVSSKSWTDNVAYVTGYFLESEAVGTLLEAGIKTTGGVLMSRVAININKSSSESLTIDWTLRVQS